MARDTKSPATFKCLESVQAGAARVQPVVGVQQVSGRACRAVRRKRSMPSAEAGSNDICRAFQKSCRT
eukprot:6206665-Pleurochrysis_carterae.AAC.3